MFRNLHTAIAFLLGSFFCFSIQIDPEKTSTRDPETKTPSKTEHQLLEDMVDSSYSKYLMGNFSESFRINLATIKRAEAINDYEISHYAYNYLGYDYLSMQDTAAAMQSFIKSHEYARKSKIPQSFANSYTTLATMYATDPDTYDKAVRYFENALIINHKIEDQLGLENTYLNYGEMLLEKDLKGNLSRITDSLNSQIRKPYAGYDFIGAVNVLLAKIYLNQNDYKTANKYLEETITSDIYKDFPEIMESAFKEYSRSLAGLGRFEEAYKVRIKYDSLFARNERERNSEKTAVLATKFQLDNAEEKIKQQQRLTRLEEEKVQEKTTLNYIMLGVIILGAAMIVMLFYIAKKRKSYINNLRAKNIEIKKAQREAERLAQVKSNFFSTVSHELRTPLYGVIGLSSILLEKNQGNDNLQELQSLKFSADYLLALVNDVLHLNKIDSKKKLENDNDIFNLENLLENIGASFEYLRVQNKNELVTQYDPKLPHLIKGNSTELSQILMNLIGNACKFTENGTITISVNCRNEDQKSHIHFRVSDTGQGIAPDKIKHMFEEFAQGENKNITYQGTGLGLSIVKKLLKAAGSEIVAESEVGKGSTFSFEMTYEIIEETSSSNIQQGNLTYDATYLEDKRVLVVEDNRINQMVTRKILERDKVICEIAENGQEAVALVFNSTYDLILMDVNMPIMNGIEATKHIRKFSQVPIIALTAVELEEMRAQIYECGMDDIIVKPYDVTQFQQAVIKGIAAVESQNVSTS